MSALSRCFVLFCVRRCFVSARIGDQSKPSTYAQLEAQPGCPYCGGPIDEYERPARSSAQCDGWGE